MCHTHVIGDGIDYMRASAEEPSRGCRKLGRDRPRNCAIGTLAYAPRVSPTRETPLSSEESCVRQSHD